ncbi:MAG: hypothetical protein R3B83_05975 [Nitrospirales bacterium]|nr:hypothetical protein [Nitrospirales bacterium]
MVAPHWLWAEQVVQAVVDRGSTGNSIPVPDKKHFPERADKNILMELMEHSPSLTVTKVTPEILADIPPGGTGSFDVRFNVSERHSEGHYTDKISSPCPPGAFRNAQSRSSYSDKNPKKVKMFPPPPPEVEPGPWTADLRALGNHTPKAFGTDSTKWEWDGKSTGYVERWHKKGKRH